ncbi:MAG: hypothetical protein N2712_00695 [Brevinematales bacterium]|nr:hypothetical protein [Brevinematales bacterium]
MGKEKNEFTIELGPETGDEELDIIYMFTVLKEYKEITSQNLKELMFFLKSNSSSLESGFFSMYTYNNKWYLLYNLSFRRSSFTQSKFKAMLLISTFLLSTYKDLIRKGNYD